MVHLLETPDCTQMHMEIIANPLRDILNTLGQLHFGVHHICINKLVTIRPWQTMIYGYDPSTHKPIPI